MSTHPELNGLAPNDESREEIRLLAYYFYQERRSAPGSPLDDWLKAEKHFASAAQNLLVGDPPERAKQGSK